MLLQAKLQRLDFFKAWLANPMRVAAVAPSSQSLARLITREIGPATGPVLELGPGTGAFTDALLARGVAQHDLTLVEFGEPFARKLMCQYPEARVLCMDAGALRHRHGVAVASFGATVSGLPLLSMPVRKVAQILAGSFAVMCPGAAFYQFTYGPRCPVPDVLLRRLGLTSTRVGQTLFNLPPASVYKIVRA